MTLGALQVPGDPRQILGLILAAAMLLAGLLALVYRRPQRRHLAVRIIMTSIAVMALLLMALQPRWSARARSQNGLLLTPGAPLGHAKALQATLNAQTFLLATADTATWASSLDDFNVIPDAAYLKRHHAGIDTLHVAGHGLAEHDWEALAGINIIYHAAALAAGIKHMHWQRNLMAGQRLHIRGVLAPSQHKEGWLYLSDPGGVIDSLEIDSSRETPFQFSLAPHDTGRFLYEMHFSAPAGNEMWREKFAVVVAPPPALHILVIEASPNFETAYLMRWLAKQKNAVACRTTISRERHRFAFLNHAKVDLLRLNPSLLKRYDLLLIDGRALRDLSASERASLREAIAQNGLGVLLMPDEIVLNREQQNFSGHEFFLNFKLTPFADLEERLVKPGWPGQSGNAAPALPAEPFGIEYNWNLKPLIKDEHDRILAAANRRGKGWIALQLVRDSYRWILAGASAHYAAYWSHLLAEISRSLSDEKWDLPETKPIIVDHPLRLRLTTESSLPVGIIATENGETDSLYLRQDAGEATHWWGTYWPRESGWHEIATLNGVAQWFYVYEKNAWQTWQETEKIAATERYVWRQENRVKQSEESTQTQTAAIPLLIFFLMFLGSCSYLWLERKL